MSCGRLIIRWWFVIVLSVSSLPGEDVCGRINSSRISTHWDDSVRRLSDKLMIVSLCLCVMIAFSLVKNSTIYEYVIICHSTSWIIDTGSLLLHCTVQSQCVCTCLMNTGPGLWRHKSRLRLRSSVSSVNVSTVISDRLTSLPQSTLWGSNTHLEEPEVSMLLYVAGCDHTLSSSASNESYLIGVVVLVLIIFLSISFSILDFIWTRFGVSRARLLKCNVR